MQIERGAFKEQENAFCFSNEFVAGLCSELKCWFEVKLPVLRVARNWLKFGIVAFVVKKLFLHLLLSVFKNVLVARDIIGDVCRSKEEE